MTLAKALINALGKQPGTPLKLENGVCALFDQEREVASSKSPLPRMWPSCTADWHCVPI